MVGSGTYTNGDTISFNGAQVALNGTPKFVGTVGLDSDRVAVKLTRKITAEEEAAAMSHGR